MQNLSSASSSNTNVNIDVIMQRKLSVKINNWNEINLYFLRVLRKCLEWENYCNSPCGNCSFGLHVCLYFHSVRFIFIFIYTFSSFYFIFFAYLKLCKLLRLAFRAISFHFISLRLSPVHFTEIINSIFRTVRWHIFSSNTHMLAHTCYLPVNCSQFMGGKNNI